MLKCYFANASFFLRSFTFLFFRRLPFMSLLSMKAAEANRCSCICPRCAEKYHNKQAAGAFAFLRLVWFLILMLVLDA